MIDNFFKGCQVTWHNHDRWPMRNSFMVMRGNALIDLAQPYLMHFSAGWGRTQFPENFRNCLVDFNRVRMRKDVPLIDDACTKVRTLDEVRKQYGWELHGDFATYDKDKNDLTPESMGGSAVTFRVPWGEKSHLARPMLSDAGINGKWPSTAEMANNISVPSFFWRFSDGNYNDRTFSDGFAFNWPWYHNDVSWQPEGGDLLSGDKGQRLGCQWYIGAEERLRKGCRRKAGEGRRHPEHGRTEHGQSLAGGQGHRARERPGAGRGILDALVVHRRRREDDRVAENSWQEHCLDRQGQPGSVPAVHRRHRTEPPASVRGGK